MSCPRCGGDRIALRPGPVTAVASRCACAAECQDCGGSGWLERRRPDGYEVVTRCACAGLDERVRLLDAARIPSRFSGCTLDNFIRRVDGHDAMLPFLRQWIERFSERNRGLLFCGPTGLGKTHLAIAILRQVVLTHALPCRFVEFLELLSDIRASFGVPGGERRVLEPLVSQPLLVVDELGAGRGSDFEQSVLDQLIGTRYNRSLPTVFTTNYPLAAAESRREEGRPVRLDGLGDIRRHTGDPPLEDRVGARIHSRVMAMCKPFLLGGAPDYRPERYRESDGAPGA